MDAEILEQINDKLGGGPEHIVSFRQLLPAEEAKWEEVQIGTERYDVHHWLWCSDNTTCGLQDRDIKEILDNWGFDPGSANSIMELDEEDAQDRSWDCNVVKHDGEWYYVEA